MTVGFGWWPGRRRRPAVAPQPEASALEAGERGRPLVQRRRSLQARAGQVAALALVTVLGGGTLAWYYARAVARPAEAREQVEAASVKRAQGEVHLPPLGAIGLPELFALPQRAAGEAEDAAAADAAEQEEEAGEEEASGEPEVGPEPVRTVPVRGYGGSAAPDPVQQALERRLGGPVFMRLAVAHGEGLGAESGDEGGAERAAGGGASLAASLVPEVTPAVAARVLPSRGLVLPKGAFLDCTLETAIDSTLPGLVTCITATDTFGADGRVVLLERGTKLVGETRGGVRAGQARVFVVWSEARTPEGVVVDLASPGADELGRAGLPGRVDRQFEERFGAAILLSVIEGAIDAAVAAQRDGGDSVVVSPSGSRGVMTEVLKETVTIPPRIVKAQGERVTVLVARDLDFRSVYALRRR